MQALKKTKEPTAAPSTKKKKMSVKKVVAKKNTKKITVWTERNGQDDLRWYTAEREDATHYSKTIEISNLPTESRTILCSDCNPGMPLQYQPSER